MSDIILVQYCKSSDYDSATSACVAPFYGPALSFPPPLDVGDALLISAAIAGCWGLGFMIRQGRRVLESG
jgi:hypothetical protein